MTAFSPPWPETCWIVSPSTSAAKSATLTSSSFSGRMMAVISFMTALPSLPAGRSRFQGANSNHGVWRRPGHKDRRVDGRTLSAIGGSGDLVEVEALNLLLGSDAHSDCRVEDLEEDEARGTDPDQVRADPDQLGDQLLAVSVEEAGDSGFGTAVEAAAVSSVGEKAKGDQAPGPVDTVDGDRADRIIDLEDVFDEQGAIDDHDASDRADQDGRGGRHESAGSRDGDETRQHPVGAHRRIRAPVFSPGHEEGEQGS